MPDWVLNHAGWESQLLETGFLAMFLVPWLSLARFPKGSPTPLVCVWGYRWLMFRIMVSHAQSHQLKEKVTAPEER